MLQFQGTQGVFTVSLPGVSNLTNTPHLVEMYSNVDLTVSLWDRVFLWLIRLAETNDFECDEVN